MAADASSSILHSPQEKMDVSDDVQDLLLAKRGCCSWIPCFGRGRSAATGSIWWQRMRPAEYYDPWWIRGWKKVREWSEIVAGPKWKTFIRRFNRNHRAFAYRQAGKFRYDEHSYALNFDVGTGLGGGGDDDDDEDFIGRDFYRRYVSAPASAKSSIDLAKEGQEPSFT